MKLKTAALLSLIIPGVSSAATINIDRDLSISGGISGGLNFMMHPGFDQRAFNAQLDDFLVEINTPDSNKSPVDLYLGLGSISPQIVSPSVPSAQGTPLTTGIQYGWFEYQLNDLNFSLGHIATKVGYESSISYQNKHISRGILWNAQPTYYPGARLTTKVANFEVYGELTNAGPDRQAAAVGAGSQLAGLSYSFSYLNQKSGTDYVDVIVETKVANVDVGINFDYIKVNANNNDAIGIAAYAALSLDNIEMPVRVEYGSDNTSGIFGGSDNALTFTATPTKWIDKKTYIRGELTFTSTKNKIFQDGDGDPKNSQFTLGTQIGVLF